MSWHPWKMSTNSEPIFPADSWLTTFSISSFAVMHFLSHSTIVYFQNDLLKWRESLLPLCSILASFSLHADLEGFMSPVLLPNLLWLQEKIFLLLFVLLPAAFSTFPVLKTLMLWPALWILYSAEFLLAHYSYQCVTFSCMASWWPHSLSQRFPACNFPTALLLLFKHRVTKFVFPAATFPWPLSIKNPKPILRN